MNRMRLSTKRRILRWLIELRSSSCNISLTSKFDKFWHHIFVWQRQKRIGLAYDTPYKNNAAACMHTDARKSEVSRITEYSQHSTAIHSSHGLWMNYDIIGRTTYLITDQFVIFAVKCSTEFVTIDAVIVAIMHACRGLLKLLTEECRLSDFVVYIHCTVHREIRNESSKCFSMYSVKLVDRSILLMRIAKLRISPLLLG